MLIYSAKYELPSNANGEGLALPIQIMEIKLTNPSHYKGQNTKTGRNIKGLGIVGLFTITSLIVAQAYIFNGDENTKGAALADKINAIITANDEANYSNQDEKRSTPTIPASSTPTPSTINTPQQNNASSNADRQMRHQLQLNLNFLASWSYEDIFIDHMKLQGYPDDFKWLFIFNDDYWNTKQAEEKGYIDQISGDIKRAPPNIIEINGPIMLPGYQKFPAHYAGDWVLTWQGRASATIEGGNVRVLESTTTPDGGRMVFRMPQSGGEAQRPRFRNVKSGIGKLKLYRLRDETAVKNGALWNPDFINIAKDYHVLRPMLAQDMNDTPVRRFDEVATPEDSYFVHREPVLNDTTKPRHGRYGIPYEYLLDLAKTTDTDLWLHVPVQIGSNLHHNDVEADAGRLYENALANGKTIIEDEAWDVFARALSKRIIASDYPKDRPLYIELGNEIWNYAWPFVIATKYVEGIGRSLKSDESTRYGYGALSARLILAMETHLANSGYTPTYIITSQTAVPDSSGAAYRGLVDFLRTKNIDPDTILPKTGIALTTYHGGADAYKELLGERTDDDLVVAWERAIRQDREGLKKKLHDRYINGGKNILFGKNWLQAHWRAHNAIAKQYGTRIIGAYEGGSHDNPPESLTQSEIFMTWWREYHWGPYGSDVVRQINQMIIQDYPGVILSNFLSVGEIGNWRFPWIDGHYGETNDMTEMWGEFSR